jgi:hypothetical protein
VAISNDVAVVGASNGGLVSIFRFDGSGWSQEAHLDPPPGGGVATFFGGAVSVDGDVVVVGAQGYDIGSKLNVGAAHVFR